MVYIYSNTSTSLESFASKTHSGILLADDFCLLGGEKQKQKAAERLH
jgi:hypothetical protein